MKMFMLPVLVMRVSGRDGFFVMLFMLLTELGFLAMIAAVLHLAGERNLFDLLTDAFGKAAAKIIVGTVGVFYLFKLFLVLVDVRIFFSTSVFSQQLGALHMLPLILLLMYFAFRPFAAVGRLGEVVTPLVVVSMIVLGILTLPEVDFSGLLPLLADGWGSVTDGYLRFALWSGDFTVLLILTGKVTKCGKKIYFSLIPAAVASVFLMVSSSVLFSAYGDMTDVLTYGHNISNMMQYAVGSYKFGRFDLIIFCVWLTAVLTSAGMMMSFFSRSMNFVFGKKIGIGLTAAVGLAFFILTAALYDLNAVTEFVTHWFWLPSMIVQYGFPIVCLAAAIVTKLKNRSLRRKLETAQT